MRTWHKKVPNLLSLRPNQCFFFKKGLVSTGFKFGISYYFLSPNFRILTNFKSRDMPFQNQLICQFYFIFFWSCKYVSLNLYNRESSSTKSHAVFNLFCVKLKFTHMGTLPTYKQVFITQFL